MKMVVVLLISIDVSVYVLHLAGPVMPFCPIPRQCVLG